MGKEICIKLKNDYVEMKSGVQQIITITIICAKGFLDLILIIVNQAVIDKIFTKLPKISHIHKNHNF